MAFDIINLIVIGFFIQEIYSQCDDSTLNIKNAYITYNSENTLALVECYSDYTIQGSDSIRCIFDTWLYAFNTTCIHNNCLNLNNSIYYTMENGKVLSTYSNGKAYLKYECNENYTLTDSLRDYAFCENGIWKSYETKCELNVEEYKRRKAYKTIQKLESFKYVLKFYHLKIKTIENNTISVECDDNYTLIKSTTFQYIDEEWGREGGFSLCYHNNCLNNSLYNTVENGIVTANKYGGLIILNYECNENYKLSSFPLIMCSDGNWSGNPNKCILE
ncbi:coagulation factor XIII B chain-like [Leptopilina boulardi]|uniref:coagulation factor XIII B chain-like n=1 Tax=Leptopilina boulardi TaxID=63433 RepID=UPI0021F5C0A0|nr:coagulation factor XIII B chain-like [Leptopilina boulardi]